MDKVLLKESIKQVEESIGVSRENLKKAEHHIAEGELILKALKDELKKLK